MQKTVVLTGSTGILGALTAKMLAEQGASLVLLNRDIQKMDSLLKELNLPSDRIYAASVDLTDGRTLQTAAESALSKFGRIHALIHLVGGWAGGTTIPETEAGTLESMLNQHVWTTFNLFKSFTPMLIQNPSSHVIVVSHPVANHPTAKSGVYAAAKSAQESLTLALEKEYKDKGLRANIIQVKSIDVKGTGKGTSPQRIVETMLSLFAAEKSKVGETRISLY